MENGMAPYDHFCWMLLPGAEKRSCFPLAACVPFLYSDGWKYFLLTESISLVDLCGEFLSACDLSTHPSLVQYMDIRFSDTFVQSNCSFNWLSTVMDITHQVSTLAILAFSSHIWESRRAVEVIPANFKMWSCIASREFSTLHARFPVMYQLLENWIRYFVHNTQFQKTLMQSTQFHLFTAVNLVLEYWVIYWYVCAVLYLLVDVLWRPRGFQCLSLFSKSVVTVSDGTMGWSTPF